MLKKLCGVLLLGTLLTGCFEVDEWVRVGNDGLTSLTMKVRLGMSNDKKPDGIQVAGQQLGALGAGMSGVRLRGTKTADKDGQMIVSVEAEADRLGDFIGFYRQVTKEAAAEKNKGGPDDVRNVLSSGSFYRVKKSGGRLHIARTMMPTSKAAPKGKKKKADQVGAEMAQMMMGGMFMRFSLTVPGKVLAHNAETLDGQTLHWIYPMNYLTTHKTELWADVEATPETERALLK